MRSAGSLPCPHLLQHHPWASVQALTAQRSPPLGGHAAYSAPSRRGETGLQLAPTLSVVAEECSSIGSPRSASTAARAPPPEMRPIEPATSQRGRGRRWPAQAPRAQGSRGVLRTLAAACKKLMGIVTAPQSAREAPEEEPVALQPPVSQLEDDMPVLAARVQVFVSRRLTEEPGLTEGEARVSTQSCRLSPPYYRGPELNSFYEHRAPCWCTYLRLKRH